MVVAAASKPREYAASSTANNSGFVSTCLSRAITGLDERATARQILTEANVRIRVNVRFHIGTQRGFF